MTHWYYADAQGQRQGPFSAEELAGHVRAERLAAHSLVWRDGLETWQPLASMASELDVALGTPAMPASFSTASGKLIPAFSVRNRKWSPETPQPKQ